MALSAGAAYFYCKAFAIFFWKYFLMQVPMRMTQLISQWLITIYLCYCFCHLIKRVLLDKKKEQEKRLPTRQKKVFGSNSRNLKLRNAGREKDQQSYFYENGKLAKVHTLRVNKTSVVIYLAVTAIPWSSHC